MLSLQLRKIHFFIIDSFCLYYVIHPFYTDTKVPYIFMLRPSESLLVIKQQTVSIEWQILLIQTPNPFGYLKQLILLLQISFSYLSEIIYFQNIDQHFFYELKDKESMVTIQLFFGFNTYRTQVPTICTPRILRIRSDLQTRKYSVSFRIQ